MALCPITEIVGHNNPVWFRVHSIINQALSAIVLARQFHGERIAKLWRRRDDLQAGGPAFAAELKKLNEEIEALNTVQSFDRKHPLIAEEWRHLPQ
jgi:hypothetical protein